jgi:membrane fusion protein, multidrug efflux system
LVNNRLVFSGALVLKNNNNFNIFTRNHILILLSFVLTGCDSKEPAAQQQPQYDIGYTTIVPQNIELKDEMPGRTVASYQSEVRPQVGGIILELLFSEGSLIKKGQPLYQIDPAPFKLNLKSAESELRKTKANLTTARNKANRYARLVKEQAVSRQDYDDATSVYQQAQSDVTSAEAAVANSKIDLNYTRVTSPIAGRVGRSTVTAGALVTANQTDPLVTVQTYDPMYVDLTASSGELLQFRRDLASGAYSRNEGELSDITLVLEDGTLYDKKGKILFSDINIDQTTGSFVLRISFPNPDRILLPGMFIRASLPRGIVHDALLVPAKALMRTPKGEAQLYVIGAKDIVELRTVTTETLIKNQWLITKGLQAGDKVIVKGIQFVRPKSPVTKSHEINGTSAEK